MKKSKKKIAIICAFVFVFIAILLVSLFQISKSRDFQFFGKLVKSAETNEKKIALTFDDGPTENTQEILKVLKGLDVKATFFLCGIGIEARKEDAAAIVSNGHGIGNHSYSHKRMIGVSYNFCKEEIEKTNRLIREVGYKGEIYFRPPYFKKLFMLPLYLQNSNITAVTCDIEPETYLGFGASPDELANNVNDNIKSGSIILLHPMYKAENALVAVKKIVTTLRAKGYTFCTVEELLK